MAQNTVVDNPENHKHFGIRAGMDVLCPGKVNVSILSVDLFKTGVGFHAGAYYNLPVWKNMYVEPGLSLWYNAMGINVLATDEYDQLLDAGASVRRFGFRIPVRLGYHFDFPGANIHVFTGPELEVGLVGRLHASVKYNGSKESESTNFYEDSWMKRTNLLWQFGAGIEFSEHWMVELCGSVGMLNMHSGFNSTSYHQSNLAISLGYSF
ncbi:MAG: PorT family protein [Roseburia sp.]|nr:PorT family protein [Roseburia sp.]